MKDSFFTLTFFPRKPRAAGDGEYPLYARITTEGQKTEFTIGRKVLPPTGISGHRKAPGAPAGTSSLTNTLRWCAPASARFTTAFSLRASTSTRK